MFESRSNHKYDTVDYFQVDPHLDGNQALISLSDQLHQRGMKLMLDAVINHTSVFHPWFVQAMAGDTAARDRFVFTDNEDYVSWKGHSSLPVLDFSHAANVDTFITGENSVIRHWLQSPYHIDGWRMDVIHMLGEGPGAANNAHYVRLLRQTIKAENPEAYLLGEHFFEATSWLQGEDDPDCRRCFPWQRSEWNERVFTATRHWIAHRKALPALQDGALVDLYAREDVYIFARILDSEQCLVAVNRGEATVVVCPDLLLPSAGQWQRFEGEAILEDDIPGWRVKLPEQSTHLWVRR